MQHVIVSGVRQAALVETANLLPVENWVVVKVYATPMCTEYETFLAGTPNSLIGYELLLILLGGVEVQKQWGADASSSPR